MARAIGYATVDADQRKRSAGNSRKAASNGCNTITRLPPHATPDLATTKTNQPVSLNVLLNDYIANSNALSIVSFETNTAAGGTVTNLGNGVLQYTPATNFVGYDLFHYYVGEPCGLKSLTAAKVLVTSDASPLLGEWPLNETSGTTANEATGNGPAATLYGSANFGARLGARRGRRHGAALGRRAATCAFKGTWFDSFNGNMSISLWVKPDATPSGEQMLFMKSDNDWTPRVAGFSIGMNGGSFFFAGSTFGWLFSGSASPPPSSPQPGVWYHLVAEIDRASSLVQLYVNGVEYTGTSNTRTIPTGEFISGDNWPVIGAANSEATAGAAIFIGAIDDVRLYTKALRRRKCRRCIQGAGLLPAGGPHPADGESNVAFQPTLTWQPGNTNNFQYNVYLGTNAANVAAATTNSAEFQGQVSVASFTPATPGDQHGLLLARGRGLRHEPRGRQRVELHHGGGCDSWRAETLSLV